MKISIIHPSRSRPTQAAATAKAWLSSTKELSRVEYIGSWDKDDDYLIYSKLLLEAAEKYSGTYAHAYVCCCIKDNKSAIQAINNAAEKSTGDLLIVISDDFNTPPLPLGCNAPRSTRR